jgi:2-amino-4-hydroxy-6-hydroxymethyldihydropteridine diphosphokinase
MILIALGSNLPFAGKAPPEVVTAAIETLAREGIEIVARSRLYSSAPWPTSDQPRFANAVARVKTALDPPALMARLHRIEHDFGRMRGEPNAARTLDLDLIDYDGRVVEGPISLPHPRLAERAFVLLPLAEVAPEWVHPVTGAGVAALIAALPPQDVRLI